jgi:diguanylate cyclase (GGDEF)-like protein
MKVFRRLLENWIYLLVFTPFVTDIIENGHFPARPREYVTEVLMGILIAVGIVIIHRHVAMLRTVAETDALTGLLNRRRFMDDLEREVKLSRRLHAPLSLVYIDVNDFKLVNDTHGHAVGDAVLREIGELLHHTARRDIDYSYRVGGDEFALLLIGASKQQGEDMLNRLHAQHLDDYRHLRNHGVTLSFGIAYHQAGESADAFLQRADAMMYQRKMQRRGVQQHAQQQMPHSAFVSSQDKMIYI